MPKEIFFKDILVKKGKYIGLKYKFIWCYLSINLFIIFKAYV